MTALICSSVVPDFSFFVFFLRLIISVMIQVLTFLCVTFDFEALCGFFLFLNFV